MNDKSKLPKFMCSRRPLTGNQQILPFDRIRPGCGANSLVQQNSSHGGDGSTGGLLLSRDLSKMTGIRKREGSPEATRPNAVGQYKLRRSRSACDLRDTREIKRAKITLAPIPCKSTRLPAAVPKVGTQGIGGTTKPLRKDIKPFNAIRPIAVKAAVKEIPSQTVAKSCTSTTTAGATKPITRKVPSYDFKTRFHNLLEKHKTLQAKYEANLENMHNIEDLAEQLEESQAQLFSTKEALKHAKNEVECLQRQTRCQCEKIDSLTSSLENTTEELTKLKQDYEKISNEHKQLSIENADLREKNKELMNENAAFTEIVNVCREEVFRSNMERKELHNTVMDLRGNIRVFCRVRPPLQCEEHKTLCSVSFLDESTLEIEKCGVANANDRGRTGTHTFSFDHVFHQRSTQEDIFQMVSPLIQSALDGYNICIFAYGQTGSGKTFTMDGTAENIGVIPRTVDLLFNAIEQYKRFGWEYEITATFLEIYNEVLYDLLSNEQKDMEIRMCKDNKNNIYVSNLTRTTVQTEEELRNLMTIAKMYRATATTINNERSSRSHAVTKIELIGKHSEKGEICIGSINLVDLAGSESPKTSTRMNETKNINRSLSELTNVILALVQKQNHIPYRNSKLTHLLMPSLGGNSKTLMFINVAPLDDCFVESVKSLRFAASVNSCKMAKAKRNKVLNTSDSAF